MHAIAPRTIKSGVSASQVGERHGAHSRHVEKDVAFAAHPRLAPERSERIAPPLPDGGDKGDDAPLDEGDVVLHILGAGLGPEFSEFVCRGATKLHLRGWARCEAGGLTLRAVGREAELAALVHEMCEHTPSDASIRAIEPDSGDGGAALPEHGFVVISADFGVKPEPHEPGPMQGVVPDW